MNRHGQTSFESILRDHSSDIRALKHGPGRWIYVGDYPGDPNTTPESPNFENGWGNSGEAGFPAASFHVDKWRKVQIRGAISGGAIGTSIFTLPREYRPNKSERYVCAGDGDVTIIQIDPDGAVIQVS